jgi:uncharacterized membrane protein
MSQFPPTPPPPPPPPGGGATFSVGEAMSYGWKAYWRNAGPLIVIAIIVIAINVVIQLVGGGVTGIAASIVLDLIDLVVLLVLAMGLIRASLAVVEGRTPEVGMLLHTDGFGPYLVGAILVGLGVFVGTLLCIIPGVILAVMWQFFGYVIVEQPTTGPTDAMRRSVEITKGHRWPLFGLLVLLFLINLVGALLFGIGLIFTYGITAVTVAWAYKTLSGQPVAPA